MAKYGLILLLILSLIAILWPLPKPVEIRNRLAAWPYSSSHQKVATQIIVQPTKARMAIKQWERTAAQVHSPQIFLHLATLYYQLGKQESAMVYWQRAAYLDPLSLLSRPLPQP